MMNGKRLKRSSLRTNVLSDWNGRSARGKSAESDAENGSSIARLDRSRESNDAYKEWHKRSNTTRRISIFG